MERTGNISESNASAEIAEIEIASIVEAVKVRVKTSRSTVDEYAAAMASGANFPAITCYRIGDQIVLSDGAHRLAAVRKNGGTTIRAIVRDGSKRDLLIAAVTSAAEFGLRFSTRDKQHQIGLFLSSYPKMKDREIGRAIGCDGKTVAAHRARLEAAAAEIPQPDQSAKSDATIAKKLTRQLERLLSQWPDSEHAALRALLVRWSDAPTPSTAAAE